MVFRAYNSKGVDKNQAKCNMGFRAYDLKGVDKNEAKMQYGVRGVQLKSTDASVEGDQVPNLDLGMCLGWKAKDKQINQLK